MRKKLAVLIAAVMVFTLAGCNGGGQASSSSAASEAESATSEASEAESTTSESSATSEASEPAQEGGNYKIGLITGTQTQDYYVLGLRGAEAAIHDGDELIALDSEQDISKQYDQISDLISQEVDAIILAAIDTEAMIAGLELIEEAGIPCFTYDQVLSEEGEALVEGQIYISDYTIGRLGGEAMAEALKEKNGEYTGKVMTYAASYYLAGELRLQGFNEAIEKINQEQGGSIEVFYNSDDDWASDNAVGVVESVLLANPDMSGFWGWSELPTIGAVQCFEENECLDKMAITSNECSSTMYDYIEQGKIYAGTELNGFGLGQAIVEMAYEYLEGGTAGSREHEIFNVTKDNLDEAVTPFVEL